MDPPQVPEKALFSFDPLVFLYFVLAFFIVPYPIYHIVAKRCEWEISKKTVARHWSDSMLGLSYGVILYIFGNYSRTFGWITVVAFYPSLFIYAIIAEQPYAKKSLPSFKSWPKGMWILFLVAVGITLAFSGIHIYLATQLPLPFVIYYVCSLLIPLCLLIISILLMKEVNSNWFRTKYHFLKYQRLTKKSERNAFTIDEAASSIHVVSSNNSKNVSPSTSRQFIVPRNPYSGTISLHIHHWQIFYVLAFFTRFTHPISQVAAGIVLACYMQGVCAYGYDPLINDNL